MDKNKTNYGQPHDFYPESPHISGLKAVAKDHDHLSRLIAVAKPIAVDTTADDRVWANNLFTVMLDALVVYEQQNNIEPSYPQESHRP